MILTLPAQKDTLTRFLKYTTEKENQFLNKNSEVKLMEVNVKNELTYLMIFYSLKKLLENGEINREVFDRLNIKNAESQGCKAVAL